MKSGIAIILALLIVGLAACGLVARRSKRPVARQVSLLEFALIPPMIGNLLIILSEDRLLSSIGSYIYFIGLDITVVALLLFSVDYCVIRFRGTNLERALYAIVAIDIVQILLNPITGFTFATTEIIVEGAPYYQLVPLAGQAIHRVIAYGIFFVSISVFVWRSATCPRLYRERFLVILASMLITGAWETFYIFSRSPIDQSMIGFGVFGLLVFYFAIRYKPMRLLDRMLSRVVSGMENAVFFFDADGTCIYGNDTACSWIGATSNTAMPSNAASIVETIVNGWTVPLDQDSSMRKHVVAGGEERFIDVTVQNIFDEESKHLGSAVTVRDATEDEQALQRERLLATRDRLTGLYNKEHLYDKARELIDANPDTSYLVGAIDVKDFKIVNDIFSKEFGDAVLVSIADTIRKLAQPHEVYGRLSGDKFGFVLPESELDVAVSERLLRQQTVVDSDINYNVVKHMGLYRVAERSLPVSVMFDRAFMAIASIKNDFQRLVAFYDDSMRTDTIWNQQISAQLESAIKNGEIRPYLQPLVNVDGVVEGAEILVRWIHPDEGFLSPARFIPVFESNGMIARLDQYMWECACRILRDWQDRGIDRFLSVNISPKDFYFIDVYETIRKLVDKYGIDERKLRLEITETVMMSDIENRLRILEDLRRDGFLVEMDDFGSGYSSLNMLKDIPVDVLKIDMMFLYKTKDEHKAQTILQTIINLSGELGIPSITEGVETEDQLNMLLAMGCELFQGYYFARPMPLTDFEEKFAA